MPGLFRPPPSLLLHDARRARRRFSSGSISYLRARARDCICARSATMKSRRRAAACSIVLLENLRLHAQRRDQRARGRALRAFRAIRQSRTWADLADRPHHQHGGDRRPWHPRRPARRRASWSMSRRSSCATSAAISSSYSRCWSSFSRASSAQGLWGSLARRLRTQRTPTARAGRDGVAR